MNGFFNECDEIAKRFLELKNQEDVVNQITECCIKAIEKGNTIMWCGNGGSASQSQHLAAELVGRYKIDRNAMNSIALTVDTSILTAISNDYGYEKVFCRQIEGIGRKGDVLIGLSTSGNSENVVLAFEAALKKGMTVIAFTGQKKSKMSELANLTLSVPSDVSNAIQEMHLAVGHWICGEVEKHFYVR